MPGALPEKVSFSLTETRILMLGAEMGLAFQFGIPFQQRFDSMGGADRLCHLGALALMLVTIVIVIIPMMFDVIVFKGHASRSTQACATLAMEAALGPFAVSLALSLAAAAWPTTGPDVAWGLAALFLAASLFVWYAYPCRRRLAAKGDRANSAYPLPVKEAVETPLSDRLRDILTEARIILPGAQAMLAFQMVAFFTQGYARLPELSQWVHVGAVALLLLSIICLMAPPAFHRIVEEGEETERLHAFCQTMVFLAAMPFALSLAADFYVAIDRVCHRPGAAAAAAGTFALACGLAWYGYPCWFRRRHPPGLR